MANSIARAPPTTALRFPRIHATTALGMLTLSSSFDAPGLD